MTAARRWPLDRLAVLGAAVAFGTTGTAKALGPDDATALGVGAMRILIGAAGLVLVAVVVSRRHRTTGRATTPLVPRRRQLPAVLIGALGVAIYQPAFFAGTDRNGVAVGTLVALGSGPVFVGAWELVVLHRRPSNRWAAATALAVLGGAVLVLSQRTGDAPVGAFGVLCSLLAGLGYALFATAAKSLVDGRRRLGNRHGVDLHARRARPRPVPVRRTARLARHLVGPADGAAPRDRRHHRRLPALRLRPAHAGDLDGRHAHARRAGHRRRRRHGGARRAPRPRRLARRGDRAGRPGPDRPRRARDPA